MFIDWRRLVGSRGSLAAAIILAVAAGAAGCAAKQTRPAAPPPEPQAPVDQPIDASEVPSPLPPPPSEADLAILAAREAEERGDYKAAMQLYGWASVAQGEREREGEIRYRQGILYLDPDSGLRSLDDAKKALSQVTLGRPRSERYREARILLLLLDDLEAQRAQEADLRAEIDALKAEAGALKANLEKKEQELKNIRQVLLQKTP